MHLYLNAFIMMNRNFINRISLYIFSYGYCDLTTSHHQLFSQFTTQFRFSTGFVRHSESWALSCHAGLWHICKKLPQDQASFFWLSFSFSFLFFSSGSAEGYEQILHSHRSYEPYLAMLAYDMLVRISLWKGFSFSFLSSPPCFCSFPLPCS